MTLTPTGRGSYVDPLKVPLQRILASFDRAYPEFTDIPRQTVIEEYLKRAAQ